MMRNCQCVAASFQSMWEAVTPLHLEDNPDVTQYEIQVSALWRLSNEDNLTGGPSLSKMTILGELTKANIFQLF